MADSLASLRIAIESGDIKKANDELNKLGNQAGKIEGETKKLSSSFTSLGTILTAGAIITATKQFVQMADTMTGVQNKLRLVTKSSEELATVQNELFKIAQKTRQGFAETADTYSNFAIAMGNMGKSQKEVLRTVETINKAIAISGGTTQQAAAATMQLGQAFASGTLRGDELNSILENSKGLAQAIADGMGVAIGDLRKLGSEGKITAEILASALEKSAKTVDEKFGKTSATVGQAMTQMENSILDMIGTTDQATGTTNGLSDAITYMAETITNNKAGIVEFGKDTFRTMQLAGTGVMLLGTEIASFFNNIPLAVTLTIDTLTAKIENSINNMLRGTEDATNKVKGLFGGDKVSLGKVSISTSLAKDYESSAQYLSELSSDLIKTSESLQKDIFGMTTVIKNSGGLGGGGAGAKGGATAETEKQRKARLKALEEEAKIQRGYLESYAELQANEALEDYNNKLTYLNAYADLEAQQAIEQYNMELTQLQDLADRQAGYALDLYNAITPDSQKIIEKYTDIFETMKDMSVETLASFAEQMNQELDKIKIDTFKIEFDTEGLEGLPKAISAVGKAMSNLAKEDKKYQENKARYQEGTEEYNQNEAEHTSSQIKGYSNLAGAMSNMFEQGSQEAQAMQAVQAGLALVEATLAVVHAGTSGDVYTAIPRMIATAAMVGTALSNIGESYNEGSASTIATIPNSGTVLGDSTAVSQSTENVTKLLENIHASEYRELRGINRAVTNMNNAIEGTVTSLFRTGGGFNPSDFATSGMNIAKQTVMAENSLNKLNKSYDAISKYSGSLLGIPGLNGNEMVTALTRGLMSTLNPAANIAGGLSSTLFGSGTETALISNRLVGGGGTVGGYKQGQQAQTGYSGMLYSQTDGGWLGSDESSVSFIYRQASEEVTTAVTSIYKSVSDTLYELDKGLGSTHTKLVDMYQLSSFSIETMGKTGEQIGKEFADYYSASLDSAVGVIFDDMVKQYQKLGEGLYETAVRIAIQQSIVIDSFSNIGKTLVGDTIELANAYTQEAGSLQDLVDMTDNYYSKFFTDAEKQLNTQNRLNQAFADMGIEAPKTLEAFKELVNSASPELYANLMSMSDAFYDVTTSVLDATKALLELSSSNIKAFVDSLLTPYELAENMASSLGVNLAQSVEELRALFNRLAYDSEGLSNAELELLNANKALLLNTDEYNKQLKTLNETLNSSTKDISTLDGILNVITSTVEKLRGASRSTSESLSMFYDAMAKAQALASGSDYKAYSEAVQKVSDLSGILLNSSAFSSSADMAFAQATSASKLEGLSNMTITQIDVLEDIKDNTAKQIEAISLLASSISSNINSQIATTIGVSTDPRLLSLKGFGYTQGFASGGYTGDMAVNSIAGVVHGKEYVVNAQTTKDLGLNNSSGVFKSMSNELQSVKNLMVKLVADNDKQLHTQRALLAYQEGA